MRGNKCFIAEFEASHLRQGEKNLRLEAHPVSNGVHPAAYGVSFLSHGAHPARHFRRPATFGVRPMA
jgi:hypothetical protein